MTDLQGGQEGVITTHMPIGPPFRPPSFSSSKACPDQSPPTSPPQFGILLTGAKLIIAQEVIHSGKTV